MAKFCLACGEPLGTRQLMHDTSTCERCRQAAAHDEAKAGSGLFRFAEQVDQGNPLTGTGRLTLPGSDTDR